MRNPKPVNPTNNSSGKYSKDVSHPLVVDPIKQAMLDAIASGFDVPGMIDQFETEARIQLAGVSDFERNATVLAFFDTLSEEHKSRIGRAFHAAIRIDVRPLLQDDPEFQRFMHDRVQDNVERITRIGDEMVQDIVTRTQTAFDKDPFSRSAMKGHFESSLGRRRVATHTVSQRSGEQVHRAVQSIPAATTRREQIHLDQQWG